ncbi:hypothetical protein TEA_014012 [Camellia sinensis var. sinensis]|uniref:ZF-HD dimerization-type domain-containing protein n=1 Tax=Camellia sinensis var. sinensis TaxID=542762 RepID=A0A4S4EGY5_CAMSN|nr:hypothetical protein TEA_014012 [Camellia sinensis var. sinensis]
MGSWGSVTHLSQMNGVMESAAHLHEYFEKHAVPVLGTYRRIIPRMQNWSKIFKLVVHLDVLLNIISDILVHGCGTVLTNGVLRRHYHPLHYNHHLNGPPPLLSPPAVATFKECLKNHAATLSGHAVDDCGEFMPSPTSISTDPISLKCAACVCHRNFHRREPEDPPPPSTAQHVIEY